MRDHERQRPWLLGLWVVLTLLGLLPQPVSGRAQDATPVADLTSSYPARPAVVRHGTCSAPGAVVATLPNLTLPRGARVGQASLALLAQGVQTQVPLPMTTLLQQPTFIEARRSPKEPNVVIACGEIGGTVDGAGVLTVGLRPVGDAGVIGMAHLQPSADGAETEIGVFVAGEVGRGQRRAVTTATSGGTGTAVQAHLGDLGTPSAMPGP